MIALKWGTISSQVRKGLSVGIRQCQASNARLCLLRSGTVDKELRRRKGAKKDSMCSALAKTVEALSLLLEKLYFMI